MNYIISFCIVLLMASCRTAKPIVNPIPKLDTLTSETKKDSTTAVDSAKIATDFFDKIVNNNRIEFSTFTAKLKVDYDDGDRKLNDITAFIRIKKDSAIWISLNALLTEAVRVIITPDSVKVMDKLNKTIQYKDLKFLQDITHLPVNFSDMQNLILGTPMFLKDDKLKLSMDEKVLQFVIPLEGFINISDFDRDDLSLQKTRLNFYETIDKRSATLNYVNYEPVDGRNFSNQRMIMVSEKKQLSIVLEFKQVNFDKAVNFPFTVPGDYKLK